MDQVYLKIDAYNNKKVKYNSNLNKLKFFIWLNDKCQMKMIWILLCY